MKLLGGISPCYLLCFKLLLIFPAVCGKQKKNVHTYQSLSTHKQDHYKTLLYQILYILSRQNYISDYCSALKSTLSYLEILLLMDTWFCWIITTVCVYPFSCKGGINLFGDHFGSHFFQTELKAVSKVSAYANLKRFQHKVVKARRKPTIAITIANQLQLFYLIAKTVLSLNSWNDFFVFSFFLSAILGFFYFNIFH